MRKDLLLLLNLIQDVVVVVGFPTKLPDSLSLLKILKNPYKNVNISQIYNSKTNLSLSLIYILVKLIINPKTDSNNN